MEYHILASGSKGNSTFIYVNGVGFLIDCGITRKQLLYKLSTIGFNEDDINFVFLTHEHYDHSKNIKIFSQSMIYTGVGTMENLPGDNYLQPYLEYDFAGVQVTPLAISHDVKNPLAFIFKHDDKSLLYMTDTGYVSKKNQSYLNNLTYYIIESNHDVETLMNTNRPLFLKRRIYEDLGHLNNEYSANLMAQVIGADTREIVLAHLSQEANSEDMALKAFEEVFGNHGLSFTNFKCASQVDIVSGGENER